MRIALVQDYLRLGGTERQSVELANAFVRAGHDVLLLTFRPGGALDRAVDPQVTRVSLQTRDWHLDWFAPRLLNTLRAFAPDVVQAMGRMANVHAWRVVRALPAARLVATFRTGRRIPALYGRSLRTAHAVVANSQHAAEQLVARHQIKRERVHVIRNGVAAELARIHDSSTQTRARLRAELGAPADVCVLLCCAMMRPGKGHRDLIDIASGLDCKRPWALWLAGEGTERRHCEARVRARGLGDRVRFLGARADTAQLYAAADIAVLTSHTESLPNFLVEAQWHGLPIVAWDVSGVRETFAPGESGALIREHDGAGVIATLHALMEDAPTRARMSEAARTYARREFEPAQQRTKYLDLYAEVRVKA